jgi:hypothetical protein
LGFSQNKKDILAKAIYNRNIINPSAEADGNVKKA